MLDLKNVSFTEQFNYFINFIGHSSVRYAKCKFHGSSGENYANGYLRLKEDVSFIKIYKFGLKKKFLSYI